MIVQEFIHWDQFVRCLCLGQEEILPMKYDPRERRYLVEHAHLSPELGARVVQDSRTLVRALGYDMNSIEFAVRDGVPYAIDFMNPAPDMDVNSLTPHYFEWVVKHMADMAIRLANEPRPQAKEMRWQTLFGGDVGRRRAGPSAADPPPAVDGVTDSVGRRDRGLPRPPDRRGRGGVAGAARQPSSGARASIFGDRPLCTVLRPRFLRPSSIARSQTGGGRGSCARVRAGRTRPRWPTPRFRAQFGLRAWEEQLIACDPGFREPSPTSRLEPSSSTTTGSASPSTTPRRRPAPATTTRSRRCSTACR